MFYEKVNGRHTRSEKDLCNRTITQRQRNKQQKDKSGI